MRFLRQEFWSGLSFPSPEILPDPESEFVSPALTGRYFTAEPRGKPKVNSTLIVKPDKKMERVWRKGNPPTLLVGMQTSTATMENSVEIP